MSRSKTVENIIVAFIIIVEFLIMRYVDTPWQPLNLIIVCLSLIIGGVTSIALLYHEKTSY